MAYSNVLHAPSLASAAPTGPVELRTMGNLVSPSTSALIGIARRGGEELTQLYLVKVSTPLGQAPAMNDDNSFLYVLIGSTLLVSVYPP